MHKKRDSVVDSRNISSRVDMPGMYCRNNARDMILDDKIVCKQ